MSTPELKEKLTKLINNSEDNELLEQIYQMVSEDLEPYKLTEVQKASITKARQEIRDGLFSNHEEVKKRTSEWLKK